MLVRVEDDVAGTRVAVSWLSYAAGINYEAVLAYLHRRSYWELHVYAAVFRQCAHERNV